MVEWRAVSLTLAIVALCFIGIPIKIDNLKSLETRLLFDSYLARFNKSYDLYSKDYEERYKNFKVT